MAVFGSFIGSGTIRGSTGSTGGRVGESILLFSSGFESLISLVSSVSDFFGLAAQPELELFSSFLGLAAHPVLFGLFSGPHLDVFGCSCFGLPHPGRLFLGDVFPHFVLLFEGGDRSLESRRSLLFGLLLGDFRLSRLSRPRSRLPHRSGLRLGDLNNYFYN